MTIPAVEKKKLEHIKKLIDGALEGKTIQREFDDVWCDYGLDSFLDEFDTCEMRVKPEPITVKLSHEDCDNFENISMKGIILKTMSKNTRWMIISWNYRGVNLKETGWSVEMEHVQTIFKTYEELLDEAGIGKEIIED